MIDPSFQDWLLQAQTPSIRYLTHRNLLHKPQSDIEVQTTWATMKAIGPIPAILAEQTKTGSWAGERSFYTPKFTSTHWSMLLLAELAADASDPRLRRGALFMLDDTWGRLQRRQEQGVHGWTCFWANMLRYVLHCGLEDDPRLPAVIETLVNDALRWEWRCEHNDERPCAWGAGRALWALAALPKDRQTADVQAAIQNGLAFLLEEHNLLEGNYPPPEGGKISALWSRLNFPLFYQADTLLVLRALAELERLDHPGAAAALEWLLQRRSTAGRWRGASPFRQRTWRALGGREETERWVSLQAASILEKAGI
jgi:hypothetical protein